MTTTTITPSSRPSGRWLPVLSLLAAGGAVALGVIAITTDDVSNQPAPIVVSAPTPVAADVVEPAGGRDDGATVACRGQARLDLPCYE
jgi:hypothetical protein